MAKREYIQANKDWLEAKAKEEDVKAHPKGIYYKVLSEGNQDSTKPTVRSIITAHYTGRTIDGKQFDSSRGGSTLIFENLGSGENRISPSFSFCSFNLLRINTLKELSYDVLFIYSNVYLFNFVCKSKQ